MSRGGHREEIFRDDGHWEMMLRPWRRPWRGPAGRFMRGFARGPCICGPDQQANEFYVTAINDMGLSKDQRSNLIEDLNEDGFSNLKNLTVADLPLIESRIALIGQLAPSAAEEVNAAAFKEAYKNLVNMRQRAGNPPAAAVK